MPPELPLPGISRHLQYTDDNKLLDEGRVTCLPTVASARLLHRQMSTMGRGCVKTPRKIFRWYKAPHVPGLSATKWNSRIGLSAPSIVTWETLRQTHRNLEFSHILGRKLPAASLKSRRSEPRCRRGLFANGYLPFARRLLADRIGRGAAIACGHLDRGDLADCRLMRPSLRFPDCCRSP